MCHQCKSYFIKIELFLNHISKILVAMIVFGGLGHNLNDIGRTDF